MGGKGIRKESWDNGVFGLLIASLRRLHRYMLFEALRWGCVWARDIEMIMVLGNFVTCIAD